jgi:hypothetical protein
MDDVGRDSQCRQFESGGHRVVQRDRVQGRASPSDPCWELGPADDRPPAGALTRSELPPSDIRQSVARRWVVAPTHRPRNAVSRLIMLSEPRDCSS